MSEIQAIVMHLDMDAYFASCEEIRHPELRGEPIVVGADPRGGRGRGVVVAANYPARRFGVRSAMPINEAYRRAPAAHYIPPDHAHYSQMSHRIFDDLRASYPIEQTSIDEACLDATTLTDWNGADALAKALHERVARATGGLTASVGVGPNRLLAKVASDHRKPDGTTVVRPCDLQGFLDPLPVRRIPGIGPRTAPRLLAYGIETVRQLREASVDDLLAWFGSQGAWMQRAARGESDSRVHPEGGPNRTVSEEHTFFQDTRDRGRLMGSLRRIVGSLERELSRHDYWYRSVALKVRYADFSTHTKQTSLRRPTGDTTPARRALPGLLDSFLADRRPVRLIGIRFGDLQRRDHRTLSDFIAQLA